MIQLSVNVNKIATLRNTRAIGIPNVARFSRIALDAGAHGITIHPRPDQRHIRPADVLELADLVREFPGRELNIEGNPFFGFVEYARSVRPDQCTLVPDEHAQITSDHGWNLQTNYERLAPVVAQLKEFGCRVSLFMDPSPEQLDLARKIGADRIELYTAPYHEQFLASPSQPPIDYTRTARRATELGLGLNAGHDLNLDNLPHFVKHVPNVLEVSIGHALIADALEFGLGLTVKKYLAACKAPSV